jgi:YHS domain-containing protein
VLLAGCQSGETGYYANPATHTWSTNEGTFAMDHVSNQRVDVSKAIRRDYLGETYYFENEDNARKFDQTPDAYLYDNNNPERSSSPGSQGIRHD